MGRGFRPDSLNILVSEVVVRGFIGVKGQIKWFLQIVGFKFLVLFGDHVPWDEVFICIPLSRGTF